MAEIEIRRAVREDAESIAGVLRDSFVEYESSYTPEAFAATTPQRDQIENRMKEGPVWVAAREKIIVGTVAAVARDEALYIRGMAVLPMIRGQGVGELLLEEVERFASGHGYRRLILSTTPFLARAIRLYENSGFRPNTEGPHDLFGTPLFTMAKSLES